MDIVIAILIIAAGALGGIAGNLIASELYDRSPFLAIWILDRAVTRLPARRRRRYREEWYAHLNECSGNLGKLWHATSCLVGAERIAKNSGRRCRWTKREVQAVITVADATLMSQEKIHLSFVGDDIEIVKVALEKRLHRFYTRNIDYDQSSFKISFSNSDRTRYGGSIDIENGKYGYLAIISVSQKTLARILADVWIESVD